MNFFTLALSLYTCIKPLNTCETSGDNSFFQRILLPVDFVLFDLLVEAGATDFQLFGRLRCVALALT